MRFPLLALAALLAGCGPAEKPPAPVQASLPTDAWIGEWVGVEGLALRIARTETPGRYALRVNLLDGAASYMGTAEGDSIAFVREGRTEHIRKATGAETDLKWLADKKDCLMIQPAEGFCRD